jgi:hypothetical protein
MLLSLVYCTRMHSTTVCATDVPREVAAQRRCRRAPAACRERGSPSWVPTAARTAPRTLPPPTAAPAQFNVEVGNVIVEIAGAKTAF